MIVTFVHGSSHHRAGGVTVLYEFANALARRGHDVHFVHAPIWKDRVAHIDQIPFHFDDAVRHHLVDAVDDPGLPSGDVILGPGSPRQGLPAVFVQGFRLVGPSMDRAAFTALAPKICVAGWLVEVGRWYGVPDEQLIHVPLGLDHRLFAVRTGPHERPVDVAMLYHPFREKGWDVGYKVLVELASRRSDLRATVFSMAGPPPEALPAGVELVLDLDQPRLADEVYNATKVLVQASHHEGFGLTAVESMACGAALVTTDCGGSRDYAIPGETAEVVPAGDVSGLVEGVDRLLGDERRRSGLAEAGAVLVRRFDWDRSAALLEDFLERYVEEPERYQQPPGEDRSHDYLL